MRYVVVAVLAGATALFFSTYDPYAPDGPELLVNGDFRAGLLGWEFSTGVEGRASVAHDALVLTSHDPRRIVYLRQRVGDLLHHRLLRLSGWLRASGVRRGVHYWNTARLLLVPTDSAGKPAHGAYHVLSSLQGTSDWRHVQEVILIPPDTVSVELIAELHRAVGSFWVRDLRLQPVKETPGFSRARKVATLVWVIVGLWVMAPYLDIRRWSARHWTLALSVLVV
ncbi:MAG TPA: hypothetical protein ENH11_10020, partial [Candidatus Acetothermia bacterium]|nr:hypothetical protein [Candidatus Acetothermia bacterium]